jgi:hypothetical protein
VQVYRDCSLSPHRGGELWLRSWTARLWRALLRPPVSVTGGAGAPRSEGERNPSTTGGRRKTYHVSRLTCDVRRLSHAELKASRGSLGPRASGALCYARW